MGRRSEFDVTNRKNLLHKEPAVIDQEMILESLKKALPKGNEGKYAKELGIDVRKAEVLDIEFQSISRIHNLSHMISLKKLILSNNVINQIEGLDALVNLEELDLSFNSIKKLEGLDHLPRLKILNLHRNLITVIENLENTLRLEVLVLSTNGIKTFEDIRHLRTVVRLRALTLEGNPICDELDYRNFVLALLPDLLILDYVRIKPNERMSPGVTQIQERIHAIAELEDGLRRRASVVEANQALLVVYKDAFADGLDGDEFWNALYVHDTDGQLIMDVPGAKDVAQVYMELMSRTCHDLFVKAMRAYTMRENEYKAFDNAVKEIKDEVIMHGRHLTEEFTTYAHNAMKTLRPIMVQLEFRDQIMSGSEAAAKGKVKVPQEYILLQEELTTQVLAYVKKLHKLWYCLVTAEVELNEQVLEVGQELERSLRELMTNWMEQLRGYFSQIRDVQLQFHDQLSETIVTYGDYRMSDPNIPDNVKSLVMDKDAFSAAVQASHEHHNATIDGKEEALILNLKNWTENSMAGIRTDEIDRSRRRISEVSHFVDFHYAVLKDLKMLDHCIGVIPELRDDQSHLLTKKELKERRIASRAEKENQKRKDNN